MAYYNNVSSNLAHTCAKLLNECNNEIWNTLVPKTQEFPMEEFLSIGFSHHRLILSKTKDEDERLFYIKRCATERFSYEALGRSIASDDYHHQGRLPNNFYETLPAADQAFRAVNTFKDEYLLDYINVEELGIRDREDIDEKVVENAIIHNVWKGFYICEKSIPPGCFWRGPIYRSFIF